ncbi:hypothetical protein P5673_025352 [Acropora cervicornis]|uniref:Uncharacterized protein n=1 Tax=Acropora cervicornis TaxID=6130 RepID=A0AAD9Q2W6_ACRCE|nr:hypothetical protein P5673_025352 [Acropora cervicornis]
MSLNKIGIVTLSLLALLFCEAKAKFLHPKFKGMILEKRFDESKGKCEYLDVPYKNGETMVPDEECHDVCTCYVSTFFEGFLCEPLCPKLIDKEECEPGWEPLKKEVPAGPPEFGCLCEETECVPSFSIHSFSLH